MALEHFEQRIGELQQKLLQVDDKMAFYELFHGYGELYDKISYSKDVNEIRQAIVDLDTFLQKFEQNEET